jgi:hypothetical protein
MRFNNNLPEYWLVQHDGTDRFKEEIVDYINSISGSGWSGSPGNNKGNYYGYLGDKHIKPEFEGYNGFYCHSDSNKPNVEILTVDEFIILRDSSGDNYEIY